MAKYQPSDLGKQGKHLHHLLDLTKYELITAV